MEASTVLWRVASPLECPTFDVEELQEGIEMERTMITQTSELGWLLAMLVKAMPTAEQGHHHHRKRNKAHTLKHAQLPAWASILAFWTMMTL